MIQFIIIQIRQANMNNHVDQKYFDHTNKKIVQAPGGSSSLSLAWSNDKTDYGPPKSYSKNKKDQYDQPQEPIRQQTYHQPQQNYGRPENTNSLHYPPKYIQYNQVKDPIYYKEPQYSEQIYKEEPQYRQMPKYREPVVTTKNYGNYYEQPQAIDRAVKVMEQQRRPPSQPKNQQKSCIKINGPPRQQFSIGDDSYNYWKDQGSDKNNVSNSQKRIENSPYQNLNPNQISNQNQNQNQNQKMNYNNKPYYNNQQGGQERQKTSVKVNNPPGGKSNFVFG